MTSSLVRLVGLSLLGLALAGCNSEPEAAGPADGAATGPVYSGAPEEGTAAMPAPSATVE